MAFLRYVNECASSRRWAWHKLDHSRGRCIYQAFLAFALFCHSPPLQAQGLIENTVQRSWVNWEISVWEASLHYPHVGECGLGVLQGKDHLKATGLQKARREPLSLAGV